MISSNDTILSSFFGLMSTFDYSSLSISARITHSTAIRRCLFPRDPAHSPRCKSTVRHGFRPPLRCATVARSPEFGSDRRRPQPTRRRPNFDKLSLFPPLMRIFPKYFYFSNLLFHSFFRLKKANQCIREKTPSKNRQK